MRRLVPVLAAAALLTSPALAQDNGRGAGPGAAAHASGEARGGKPGREGHPANGDGPPAAAAAHENGGKARGDAGRGPGAGAGTADARAQAGPPDEVHPAARAGGNADRPVVAGKGPGDRHAAPGRGKADVVRVASFAAIPPRGIIAGCPPGLARKSPRCVPPGQVRSPNRGFERPDFWGLRLDEGRYGYDSGYLVRLRPDGGVGGYVPLLGGALAIGNLWPSSYQPVALPRYYESYFGLGGYDAYRFVDNVIYRVDPETAAITSIAALLTGDEFAVGSPMPAGYDVYNVPYPHRAKYYDRPDALYRYSDGYVYQIDPQTRLIAAAIELLAT